MTWCFQLVVDQIFDRIIRNFSLLDAVDDEDLLTQARMWLKYKVLNSNMIWAAQIDYFLLSLLHFDHEMNTKKRDQRIHHVKLGKI